jgi:hypothetical protein
MAGASLLLEGGQLVCSLRLLSFSIGLMLRFLFLALGLSRPVGLSLLMGLMGLALFHTGGLNAIAEVGLSADSARQPSYLG